MVVPPEARTNANVAHTLDELPFVNPLIEAWELKHLCGMYEAADNVLEDTLCDLIDELTGHVSDQDLVAATGMQSVASLQRRVAAARLQRGPPGRPAADPRSGLPRQLDGSLK